MKKRISLNYNVYPLYVGIAEVARDARWEDQGSSVVLEANVQPAETEVIWENQDEFTLNMQVLDEKRVRVRAVRTGIGKIVARLSNGDRAECVITVIDNQVRQTVSRLELNTDQLTLVEGAEALLQPIFYPKEIYNNGIMDKTLIWTSSDPGVAQVADGKVFAAGVGETTITVCSADVGRTAQCRIVVEKEIAKDTSYLNIRMKVGGSCKIPAPSPNKLIWRSDNTYVVDVEPNGRLHAYSASMRQEVSADGMTKRNVQDAVSVYATEVNGGRVWEYRVCVEELPDWKCVRDPDVEIGGKKELAVGEEVLLTAMIYPAAIIAENAQWSVSDPDIVSITPLKDERDGCKRALIRGLKEGYCCLDFRSGKVHGVSTIRVGEIEDDYVWQEEVIEGSRYIRNLKSIWESITANSVLLLWERDSLIDVPEWKEYEIYSDGVLNGRTKKLGYRVENLEADTSYEFVIRAIGQNGEVLDSQKIIVTTKYKGKVWNVLSCGAVGDGKVNDTRAIQYAIDNCEWGDTVLLPQGHVFYCGALFLQEGMTLQVDGILMASNDPKDYPQIITRWEGWCMNEAPASVWPNSNDKIVNCHRQHASLINIGTYCETPDENNIGEVVLCGKGQINGNGFTLGYNQGHDYFRSVEPTPISNYLLRGCLVKIQNAHSVYVKDLQFAYSPSWTLHAVFCRNVTFDHVHVVSYGDGCVGLNDPGHIYNGDGIDVDSCEYVNVFDSHFTTGDDGVTLKSGRNREGNELNRPNAHVRVTDCISDGDFGFGTGSETAAGGYDLLFQNLLIRQVKYFGIWFKTLRWRGGITHDVCIRDVVVDGANTAVRLSFDHSKGGATNTVNPAENPPQLYDVVIENVVGCNVQRGLWISGLEDSPIRNIRVRGCNFDGHNEISNGENIIIEE